MKLKLLSHLQYAVLHCLEEKSPVNEVALKKAIAETFNRSEPQVRRMLLGLRLTRKIRWINPVEITDKGRQACQRNRDFYTSRNTKLESPPTNP